uniref:Uncharacterized protein n=1 Tax=Panagrolaimus sp. ES5 TaxID=591445 RepID=A0AC34FDN1_9BILA
MEDLGSSNVVLAENELFFEVCSSGYNDKYLVCYESVGHHALKFFDSIYVMTSGDKISFMKTFTSRKGDEKLESCEIIKMFNGHIDYGTGRIASCGPKIKNGLVKLNSQNAYSECPVIIKKAMTVPATTTSAPITLGKYRNTNLNGSSGMETSTAETGGFFENYWWIFFILAISIIIIAVNIVS